jgi:hypothetical protein
MIYIAPHQLNWWREASDIECHKFLKACFHPTPHLGDVRRPPPCLCIGWHKAEAFDPALCEFPNSGEKAFIAGASN